MINVCGNLKKDPTVNRLFIFSSSFLPSFQASNDWSFDTFSFGLSCKGSPLRFMGYELLTRHGCLHKYKVRNEGDVYRVGRPRTR